VNRPEEYFVFISILIVLAILAAGCTSGAEEARGTIKVTVTILPQKEFVESVGGDRVDVFVLVPPGASPHSYEPTPSDIAGVSESDVYVVMGSGIEFELLWLEKIKELNPGMTVIDSSEGVSLISDGGVSDPHIWLSPENAITIAGNIRDGLAGLDPENAEYYRENAGAYMADLGELDDEISEEIGSSGVKVIMVSHPAWSYYAREYGLEQIAIAEGGKEPSPAGIKKLIDEAVANDVKVIFVSPEFSEENARAIADEIGGSVAVADPLAEDYLENMREVSAAFSGGKAS